MVGLDDLDDGYTVNISFSPKHPQTTTCQYWQPGHLSRVMQDSVREQQVLRCEPSPWWQSFTVPGAPVPLLGRLPVIVRDAPRCSHHGNPCL